MSRSRKNTLPAAPVDATFIENTSPNGIQSFTPNAAMTEHLTETFQALGFVQDETGAFTGEQTLPEADMSTLDALLAGTDDLDAQLEALPEETVAPAPVVEAETPADDEVEGDEAPATDEADADPATDEAEPVEHVEGDLDDMVEDVSDEDKTAMIEALDTEVSVRADYELTKNPGNSKMQDNLGAYRKKLSHAASAAVLCATDIDPGFINREVTSGSRFNVYAIDKVADILNGLAGGIMRNAINRAVMQSLFKFRAAGVPFTGIAALAAASDKVKVDSALRAHLVRHTVSAGVAPTQTSSTMSALSVLGVVVNKGTPKFPVWQLTDTPQTRKLEEVLKAA